MKYFKVIVVAGLCASLLSNYIMFSKLDAMENKINNLSSYQHQVISTVNSQVGNINNTINKIKEEQSWLSTVNFDTVFDEKDKSKVKVKFEWQVKELQNNSEVFFNYRIGDDEEYTSLKATPKGNGAFSATVPVEVVLEPNWHLQVISANMSERQMRVIEEKKEAFEKERRATFNYYISLSQGDMIKSSGTNIAHIYDMGARYYGFLEVRTDIGKSNKYSVIVMVGRGRMYDSSSVTLKEAYLKKYKDGQLAGEERLEEEKVIHEGGMPVREDSDIFSYKPSEEKFDYDRLVLKVVYSDGAVFEREIYSK